MSIPVVCVQSMRSTRFLRKRRGIRSWQNTYICVHTGDLSKALTGLNNSFLTCVCIGYANYALSDKLREHRERKWREGREVGRIHACIHAENVERYNKVEQSDPACVHTMQNYALSDKLRKRWERKVEGRGGGW